jgi:hypothetical protein
MASPGGEHFVHTVPQALPTAFHGTPGSQLLLTTYGTVALACMLEDLCRITRKHYYLLIRVWAVTAVHQIPAIPASDTRIAYPANSVSARPLTSQTKDEFPSRGGSCPVFDSNLDTALMSAPNTAAPQARGATRSSLACLPCRSRHLKCDATRPQCNRCLEVARQCQYAPSRRGGLDRAALAERRRRLALVGSAAAPYSAQDSTQAPTGGTTVIVQQQDQGPASLELELSDLPDDFDVPDMSNVNKDTPALEPTTTLRMRVEDVETDPLVASYYKHFYKFHPFILPRKALIRIHKHMAKEEVDLTPLIPVMRLVGHIYSAQELSQQLKDHAEIHIAQAPPNNPVLVQCRLLYSIALFWNNFKTEANREIRNAVKLAVDLNMFRQEFASDRGAGDPVLMECWRRTWWMLYIVDAYYAGTLGTMNFAVSDIDATVDLPCEEHEYESEVSILLPRASAFDMSCTWCNHKADCSQANSGAKDTGRF